MPSQQALVTAVERLLADCRSGEPDRQVAAALDLRSARTPEAAPAVRELLRSPDAAVRATGARVLGAIADPSDELTARALLKALDDTESLVRAEATDALGAMGHTAAAPAVRRLVNSDPDPLVRAAAAETLGDLDDRAAVPELLVALADEDESVRAYAAASLGLVDGDSVDERLTEALEADQTTRVRAELLGARYRLGVADALDNLLTMLEQADEDTMETLLIVVDDLVTRPGQSHPDADDSNRIRAMLARVAKKYPPARSHAEAIATRLAGEGSDSG